MEQKLHQLRHEANLLRQYLQGQVGPHETILLKRYLAELDSRAAKMEFKLARGYERLSRASRRAVKATSPVNDAALAVERQLEQTLPQVVGSAQ